MRTGKIRSERQHPLTRHRYESTHAVSDNTHRQLFRSCSGAVASHIPDSQAQPRGVGLCHMDRRVLFPDVRQLDYLARQRQCRGPGLVRYWRGLVVHLLTV